ncbi:MAG: ATP-binding protein [Chloroflexales bacterium]
MSDDLAALAAQLRDLCEEFDEATARAAFETKAVGLPESDRARLGMLVFGDGSQIGAATVGADADGDGPPAREDQEPQIGGLKLRASEPHTHDLLEHVPIGMFQSTPGEKILYLNPALATMLGYDSPEEMWMAVNQRSVKDALYADPARQPEVLADILQAQGNWRVYENRYRCKRGEIIDTILTVAKHYNSVTGEITLYGFVQDVTTSKQAEATIRRLANRLELATRAAHIGVWDWDIQKDEVFWDERMYALYGVRREDFTGAYEAWLQGIHPDDRVESDTISAQARRGERPYDTEFRVVWPDGSIHVLKAFADVIWSVDGTPERMIGVNYDITEIKHAEAVLAAHTETLSKANNDLTHALQFKSEFLAMMSHELRTPLNVILGYTQILAEEFYGPLTERQHAALDSVTQSGQHLLGILSDILDMAHLDSGAANLDLQPVAVDLLCLTALEYVQSAAQQKDIRLLRTVTYGIKGLRADERRLTQILVNLLDNAVKFTQQGGTVGLEVTTDVAQEQITFTVWDTGIGITEADYSRLFTPFTQVDAKLSRQYGGIGLGLALVRRLVDLHGGSISLTSTPGQGSRFTVSLPWAAGDNVGPQVASAEPPVHALPDWATPPRVVIADDHEPTLGFYYEVLTEMGCQVAVARTGGESVAKVQATRPDVTVLDIQMPGVDGLEVIRRIRDDPAVATVPIIALTALAMPGDRERCLEAGANVYLAKPVSMRALVAAIRQVLAPTEPK